MTVVGETSYARIVVYLMDTSDINYPDGLAGCCPDRQGQRWSDGVAGFESRLGTFYTPDGTLFANGFTFTLQPVHVRPGELYQLLSLGARRNTIRAFP